MAKQECAYGVWDSPITPELLTETGVLFQDIVIDGQDIYWTERRPKEKGRSVIVRYLGNGQTEDMIPQEFNARTRVHEYGGVAFTVKDGVIYFVNDSDQRLYVLHPKAEPKAITEKGTRFADFSITPYGILAVAEKHSDNGNVDNYLALIDPQTGAERTIASGYDFYSSPSFNAKGDKIVWISWNHPNMPWDGSELWTADFKDGKVENSRHIAGGEKEAIFQPRWAADDSLYYASDKTGWWNLYRSQGDRQENIYPLDAEFGLPQWVFGMSTWDFAGDDILAAYNQKGFWHLGLLDMKTKTMKEIDLGGIEYTQIRTSPGVAVFIMGSLAEPRSIVRLDLKNQQAEVIAARKKAEIDPENFSYAEPVVFESTGGRKSYGYYYPPRNAHCQGPKDQRPPLIVNVHGGPTSATTGVFSLNTQYWTSRGFAVFDLNYGGSTGYGREYRELLTGNWGVVDKEDSEHAAKFLVEHGLVDPHKLIIRGGSAGGYTVLSALTFGKTFNVGASYYGISDLIALAKEGHKMESHYSDRLIGLYPAQEALYKERSPLFFADQICCPVIFFQGEEDKIVPLNQAEMMYEAVKKQGILTELVVYPNEQHGFRQDKHIQDAFRKELAFYRKALNLF